MCLFSEKYPFMGCMWRKLPSVNKHSIMLSGSVISNDMVEIYDYFIDRNLMELLSDTGINDYTKSVRLNFKIRDLWKRLVLDVPENEEGPSMGGAMLAAVGCGEYPDVETICNKLVRVVDTVEPEPELAAKYEERYQKFRKIYPACRDLFLELAK